MPGQQDEGGFTNHSEEAFIQKRETAKMPQKTNHSLPWYNQTS